MPSKIQVDQIAGATGSTVTLPSGQTLDLSSGTVNLPSSALSALNASNLTSGTVPSARLSLTSSDLPTVPTTKGGTGLTTLGTANQVLRVNSGATALEFGTVVSGIVQVKFVEKTDTQSWTSTSETEITGLNVSITPTNANNKILVLGQLWTSADTSALTAYNALKRNIGGGAYSTLGNHTNDGSNNSKATGHGGVFNGNWNLMNTSISFLDNPATTSVVNYKWFAQNEASAVTFYVNRTARNSTIYHPRACSTITVMEISSGIL